jgi:hypothetical protein
MTPVDQFRAKVEARRKATYRAVKAMEPALYERAVEIGHLALSAFERDENKRAANVESAVMDLIAALRGIDVRTDDIRQP